MANPNLKQLTEELEKSLAAATPSPKKPSAPKTESTQPKVETPKTEDLKPVVRAVVEYALHRAGDNRTPSQIGEAIGLGIQAASKELNVNENALAEALDDYLGEVAEAARKLFPGLK